MGGRYGGTMHLTQLKHECLLHLFLDEDRRKNLVQTCPWLQAV